MDDEIETDTPDEVIEATEEVEQEAQAEAEPQKVEEPEQFVVTIGDEEPATEEDSDDVARPWVKELRQKNRELQRELSEFKQAKASETKAVELGKKPRLEDFDYDEDKHEQALVSWLKRKDELDAGERKKQDEAQAQQKAWEATLANHQKLRSELKVADIETADAVVDEVFSQTQRGVIVDGAKNSALVLYALGKNTVKAKELAAIKNPVKFAFAVAELETQLKVTPRKTAPLPESKLSGNASVAGAVDSQLARLEAEALKSGDRSKVIAYQRAKRKAG